jgi:solute carrier family 35 protein E1
MARLALLALACSPLGTAALAMAPLLRRPATLAPPLRALPLSAGGPARIISAPRASLLSKAARYAAGSKAVTAIKVPCGDGSTEECTALCDEEGCQIVGRVALLKKLKLAMYLVLWFGLSTGYNIKNKVRLNALPLPWTQSAASLFFGSVFVSLLWLTGLRKPPKLDGESIRTLLPVSRRRAATTPPTF